VKLDTGMGRLGTRERDEARRVAELIQATDGVALHGAMTHFATADGDRDFLRRQLEAFIPFAEELRSISPGLIVHAANSAATLVEPDSHLDLVRCGIAIYGCDPMNRDPAAHDLEPALELTSYVAAVKPAAPGQSAGYGRTFIADRETTIGTLPIGYADGIRRALGNHGEVLIGGRRYPIAGTVSMDNITADLGPSAGVRIGERATIIGHDGDQRQTAEDLARAIGTINYEITCGITARVPREYHRDGEPMP
jgi:alanine racemase